MNAMNMNALEIARMLRETNTIVLAEDLDIQQEAPAMPLVETGKQRELRRQRATKARQLYRRELRQAKGAL